MRRVVLSKTAANKLDILLKYLEFEWSEKVKHNFIEKLDNSTEQIRRYPQSCEKSLIKPELHRCVVSKQTTLYYTFDTKRIYIVTLFDNRMNPKKLKEETK
ncbi:MAG: type II toxin-antitoxin system RelE/ParE family toxin [Paludibacter sp.]